MAYQLWCLEIPRPCLDRERVRGSPWSLRKATLSPPVACSRWNRCERNCSTRQGEDPALPADPTIHLPLNKNPPLAGVFHSTTAWAARARTREGCRGRHHLRGRSRVEEP